MYEIILTKKAKQQLRKLPKETRNRIGRAIERIKIRPYHFVKKLVGSDEYSLRVGEYRVILDIKDNEMIILVLETGHRRNIYKS